jgi:hypothetical protein
MASFPSTQSFGMGIWLSVFLQCSAMPPILLLLLQLVYSGWDSVKSKSNLSGTRVRGKCRKTNFSFHFQWIINGNDERKEVTGRTFASGYVTKQLSCALVSYNLLPPKTIPIVPN